MLFELLPNLKSLIAPASPTENRAGAPLKRVPKGRPTRRNQWWPFLLVAELFLSSCAETRYVEFREAGNGTNFRSRTVAFSIAPEFYRNFPDCALVMPPSGGRTRSIFHRMIEETLALRIAGKISRVVSAAERDLVTRRMAFDLLRPDDRLALADALDCDTIVVTDLMGADHSFLLVWSEVRIGLDVRLVRIRDERVLWRGRHVADRSAGGVPLSPLGIAAQAFSSVRFSSDREVWHSVLDDAVRRIVSTLPDARTFAGM